MRAARTAFLIKCGLLLENRVAGAKPQAPNFPMGCHIWLAGEACAELGGGAGSSVRPSSPGAPLGPKLLMKWWIGTRAGKPTALIYDGVNLRLKLRRL